MSSTLDGITWHAQGEANFYRLMRGNQWVAVIHLNGEMLVWDQEQLLSAMLSSEQPAADPVQEIARQLGIQTFGDGLLAKIRQTIELLQEAAAERDQLRAEVERLKDALETESMRLAACGVAALGYFEGCAEEYHSASLHDVLALRAQLAQQQGVPVGWKLVPVEPTPEMVSAAEEAHMPFGDMDIALRMAILSAPSAPAAVQEGYVLVPVEPIPKCCSKRCEYCDGTGDVHGLDGEWKGSCVCPAGRAPVQAEPATYKAMLSAATSAANATEFSQFLSAVMDAAGLVRHGRRSKELSEYLGRMCMQYRLSAVGKEPVHAEPDSQWVAVSERLPQIKQVLSEKCTLEGRDIPTLYRSGEVLTFDGKRVSAGIVEWFHAKSPLSGVTHWMPLPAGPEVAP